MRLNEKDIPVLEGYINLTEAAEKLGITRQYAHTKAKNGLFKSIKRIGTKASFVVSTDEVDDMLTEQNATADAAPEKPEPKKRAPRKPKDSNIVSTVNTEEKPGGDTLVTTPDTVEAQFDPEVELHQQGEEVAEPASEEEVAEQVLAVPEAPKEEKSTSKLDLDELLAGL